MGAMAEKDGPRVVVAEEAGACYGVERALSLTRQAASGPAPVMTLGPLIHNPRVVAGLAEEGVGVATEPGEAAGGTLVLRTHGVTPAEEAAARAACARVVDATCPFVRRCHEIAGRLAAGGYTVVVVGEAGHPEVEGTRGHAPGALVVGSAEEARSLPDEALGRRVGVVVQTTMARPVLAGVVGALVGRVEELRVFDTICEATSGHQAACEALARRADVMVVVGGRNSANTRHLAEIASGLCPRTHHVEGPDELEASWFSGARVVGLTAGASTPAEQLEGVRDRVAELAAGRP